MKERLNRWNGDAVYVWLSG